MTHISNNPEIFFDDDVLSPGSNQVNFEAYIYDNDANIQARVCIGIPGSYFDCSGFSTDQASFQIFVATYDWSGSSQATRVNIEVTGSGTGTIFVDDADYYAGAPISEFSDFLLIPIFLIAIVVPLYLVKKRKNR